MPSKPVPSLLLSDSGLKAEGLALNRSSMERLASGKLLVTIGGPKRLGKGWGHRKVNFDGGFSVVLSSFPCPPVFIHSLELIYIMLKGSN